FRADTVPPADDIATSSAPAATARPRLNVIGCPALFVEPDVFAAIAAGDAVDHDRQPFDVGPPAGCAAGIEDDRPGAVFSHLLFDCPDQLLAPGLVGLDRLPLDQLIHLRAAIRSEERRVRRAWGTCRWS